MLCFIYGLLVGAFGMRLFLWVQEGRLVVPLYGWVLGVLAVAMLGMTVQHFIGSYQEREPKAAWMGLLFLGIPTVFLSGIFAWVILPS